MREHRALQPSLAAAQDGLARPIKHIRTCDQTAENRITLRFWIAVRARPCATETISWWAI